MKKASKKAITYLKHQLATNEVWSKKALLKIMQNQTSDELKDTTTKHRNGYGFTKADGYKLCSIGKFLNERGFLTTKQLQYVQKRISKYWMQILEITDLEKLETMTITKNN